MSRKEYCLGQVFKGAKSQAYHLGLLNECVQLWLFLNSPITPQDFQSMHRWTAQLLLTSTGKTLISIKPPGNDCCDSLCQKTCTTALLLGGYSVNIDYMF